MFSESQKNHLKELVAEAGGAGGSAAPAPGAPRPRIPVPHRLARVLRKKVQDGSGQTDLTNDCSSARAGISEDDDGGKPVVAAPRVWRYQNPMIKHRR